MEPLPVVWDVSSDDDEDDCVVLEGDPEKGVTTVDDSPTGSDELRVVGEKGQIACRDYPHPRNHCVKFPYSSTPHEKHCDQVKIIICCLRLCQNLDLCINWFDNNCCLCYLLFDIFLLSLWFLFFYDMQCHCYVCDSVAPCLKWGTGLLGTDHCHATDKSEIWRTLRENFMMSNTTPILASTNYSTLVDNAQHNHILPLDIMLSMSTATHSCPPVNLIPQNQASRPIIMHTFPSPNSSLQNQVSSPNTVPECSIATNFTIPSGTNCVRRRESGSNLVRNRYQSHSIPQHALGVRNHAIQRVRGHGVRSLGPQFLHSHMMDWLGSVGVGSTLPTNHSTHGASGFSNHVNPARQYGRYDAATGFSNNITCYGQNDVCVPQNLLYQHPSSQPNNLSSVNNYSTAYETQPCYQSNDSQNFYAYNVQGNNAPSSNVAGLSRNQALNEHQMRSQNENACGNVIQCGTARQNSYQQKHHDVSQIESALEADFSAFDSNRIEDTSQSISCLRGSGSMNISSSAKESGTQFTESTCLGSVDDIKQWLFSEENSDPVGANGVLTSELNMPSPDHCTFDVGTLFYDFENSWDCLALV
ncbi:31 kDa ribonucleoprotein [Spatholobus suberectus]|nr:31 kDa ribonucleoprotein [Spatholobus suberectus]